MPDLSHTPGIYYALAYWLSCTFYIAQLPRRLVGWRRYRRGSSPPFPRL